MMWPYSWGFFQEKHCGFLKKWVEFYKLFCSYFNFQNKETTDQFNCQSMQEAQILSQNNVLKRFRKKKEKYQIVKIVYYARSDWINCYIFIYKRKCTKNYDFERERSILRRGWTFSRREINIFSLSRGFLKNTNRTFRGECRK